MKLRAFGLALLLACAPHAPMRGVPIEQRRLVEAFTIGEAPTADQALVGVALIGPDANALLPQLLARADQGDLDPGRLADALEALGPGCITTVQAGLARKPAWTDPGLMALARLGPPGADALIALVKGSAVQAEAFAALRMAVGWAMHPWVEPGVRQKHPYLVPVTMFTPLDLGAQKAAILTVTCDQLKQDREPSRGRAQAIMESLSDTSCTLPWLSGDDPRLQNIALQALPQHAPGAIESAAVVVGLLQQVPKTGQVDLNRRGLARYLLNLGAEVPGLDAQIQTLVGAGPPETCLAFIEQMGGQPPGPELRAVLMARLRSETAPTVRRSALAWLGEWRSTDQTLWEMLLVSSDTELAIAVDGLRTMGEDAYRWLEGAMRDPARSTVQRLAAVLALPTPHDAAAETFLLKVLKQGEPAERAIAVESLAPSPAPEDYRSNSARLPALLHALRDDPSPAVRVASAMALGRLSRASQNPKPIRDALQVAMGDRDAAVRRAAWQALQPDGSPIPFRLEATP